MIRLVYFALFAVCFAANREFNIEYQSVNSELEPNFILTVPSLQATSPFDTGSPASKQACREASTTTEQFDELCNTDSLEMFYVGFNSTLFEQFTPTEEHEMISHCSRYLDIATTTPKVDEPLKFHRFRNAKDLLYLKDRSEFCVTIRKPRLTDIDFVTVQDNVSLQFHEARTCKALNRGEFRYDQFHKACENGILVKPVAFINVHAFYHPMLVSFRNAFISKYGNAISLSQEYEQQVFTFTSSCFDPVLPDFRDYEQYPDESFKRFDKVFTIAQGSGWGTFHALAECLPRIAAHYDELMKRSDIFIHHTYDHGGSGGIEKYLHLMGFGGRLISGQVIANQVYLPETSFTCGRAGFYQIRKLHEIIRNNVIKHIESKNLHRELLKMRHGVFIRRRSFRTIRNHDEIFRLTQEMFPEFHFDVFDDSSLPSFDDTILMFDRADIIIGPHGAGLTNMLLSKPGTVIVEFLVNDSIVLCYPEISVQLGMKYNGLMPKVASHGGSIVPDVDEVRAMFIKIRKYQL